MRLPIIRVSVRVKLLRDRVVVDVQPVVLDVIAAVAQGGEQRVTEASGAGRRGGRGRGGQQQGKQHSAQRRAKATVHAAVLPAGAGVEEPQRFLYGST